VLNAMPPGKPKTKTAGMTLRVTPQVKAAAELAAKADNRSVTSLVEVLILNHCKSNNITPPAFSQKENLDEKSPANPNTQAEGQHDG
jgi:hypothetical protein